MWFFSRLKKHLKVEATFTRLLCDFYPRGIGAIHLPCALSHAHENIRVNFEFSVLPKDSLTWVGQGSDLQCSGP